jgi:glycosyltransferase involved in cell wall biosynthesis
MNILIITEHADGGDGWAQYTAGVRDGLRERGHRVQLAVARGRNGDWSVLPPALQLLHRPFLAPIVARTLRRIVERMQPDVVHVAVEPYILALPLLPRAIRERVILTAHGTYGVRPLHARWTRFLLERAYRLLPRLITVSAFTKRRIMEELARGGAREAAARLERATDVIHNGIALPPWEPLPSGVRMRNILLVGGVKPRKGALEAVEACAHYARRSSEPFLFSIIGSVHEDEYLHTVLSRIRELGMEGSVSARGFLSASELERAYREASLFLMPARTEPDNFEGFGIAYLEANARGVPAIGPDTGGAAEAIEEGMSGYHVNVSDPAQIAERMAWILDEHRIDPQNCRRWAERHSLEKVAEQTEAAYRSLVRM